MKEQLKELDLFKFKKFSCWTTCSGIYTSKMLFRKNPPVLVVIFKAKYFHIPLKLLSLENDELDLGVKKKVDEFPVD
jgi:hypothetical protein